jgi:hypothetical protein
VHIDVVGLSRYAFGGKSLMIKTSLDSSNIKSSYKMTYVDDIRRIRSKMWNICRVRPHSPKLNQGWPGRVNDDGKRSGTQEPY